MLIFYTYVKLKEIFIQSDIRRSPERHNNKWKFQASLCSWTGWVETYLVADPEDKFLRDKTILAWLP